MQPVTLDPATDYHTWYSDWMKQLALHYTKAELERKLNGNARQLHSATATHHNAIARTTGMASQSQRRAQARNVVAAKGEEAIAIRGALRIYEEFPEHTKEGKQ